MISRLVSNVAERLDGMSRRTALAYWDLSTTGEDVHGQRLTEERLAMAAYLADTETYNSLAHSAPSGDALLDRQVSLLRNSFLEYQVPPDKQAEIIRRETEMEELFANYRGEVAGRRVSDNEIRTVLQKSTDSALRLEAWQASKKIGEQAAPGVLQLVRLRNEIARHLGFANYYALQLSQQEIEERELFQVLDQLKALTDQPFATMKAGLDAELSQRFGVPVDGLRAHHYADPFFQEAPPAATLSLDRFLAGRSLVEMALQTYDSIGMDTRDIIGRSDLFERPGKNQHAFCTAINREGDIRMLCNLTEGDEYWMATLLHELGHAVYDKYIDPTLPWTLRTCAHLSTTEASAMFFGRLTNDADWLHKVAGVDRAEAERCSADLFRQTQRQMLIFVRWGLVMVYFERALYQDPEQDLNSLWWQLVGELQLVAPPERRTTPDWAAKIHIATAPVYYHNYILGELTASHLGAHAARASGAPTVVGNRALGDFWRERVYAHGALYPWNELLLRSTGEALNPRHFAEQFVQGQ